MVVPLLAFKLKLVWSSEAPCAKPSAPLADPKHADPAELFVTTTTRIVEFPITCFNAFVDALVHQSSRILSCPLVAHFAHAIVRDHVLLPFSYAARLPVQCQCCSRPWTYLVKSACSHTSGSRAMDCKESEIGAQTAEQKQLHKSRDPVCK